MLEEEQSLLNGPENNEENSQELNENRKMVKADKEQETVRRRNADEDLNGEQPQISDEEYRKNANEDEGKDEQAKTTTKAEQQVVDASHEDSTDKPPQLNKNGRQKQQLTNNTSCAS
ncbi:hypothetical protein RN001_014550 [Aquatica leii]|uniref:Uncharacterized protein n=1 Tax=Aquatica leii TaxID=1421715 RepID=A0AAN7S689_9COLE|nr:hypothetical protein RN001_014550 [Aquatica leii]